MQKGDEFMSEIGMKMWIGMMAVSMLFAVSILLQGGSVIRGRMEQKVGWRRLAVYVLPIAPALTALLLMTGSDAPAVIKSVILCSFLPMVAVIDRREMIIPNRLLLLMLGYWILASAVHMLAMGTLDTEYLVNALTGGLIGASPLLVRLISKGGIGMGDIKLFAVVGLYVGKEDILRAMFFSLVLALIVLLGKRIRKQIGRKDQVSFGPYVAVGTMLMVFMNIPLLG